VAGNVLAAALPGIRVVTDPAMLPATKAPAPLSHLALLVRSGDSDAATLAAVTTARVAGVRVIAVRGDDPRADPAAIAALSSGRLVEHPPQPGRALLGDVPVPDSQVRTADRRL
jgi:hypothetical protein